MDLERLKEWQTVAKCQNLRRAAQALDILPATLSARIQGFEKSLGVTLFTRRGNALTLNESGTRFAAHAEEILSEYEQLYKDLHFVQQNNYRHLRLGLPGTALPFMIGPFLDRLNRVCPELKLDLLDGSVHSIPEGLRSGAVDVFFAPVMQSVGWPDIVRVELEIPVAVSGGQYIVLPADHPLAQKSSISLRELEGERFILYPKTAETCIRDYQLANLRASGIRYEVYDSDTAPVFNKLLVPIGKGILIWPDAMMDRPPNAVCVALRGLAYPASPCLFYAKNAASPEIAPFLRDLTAFVREAYQHEHRPSL